MSQWWCKSCNPQKQEAVGQVLLRGLCWPVPWAISRMATGHCMALCKHAKPCPFNTDLSTCILSGPQHQRCFARLLTCRSRPTADWACRTIGFLLCHFMHTCDFPHAVIRYRQAVQSRHGKCQVSQSEANHMLPYLTTCLNSLRYPSSHSCLLGRSREGLCVCNILR